MQKVTGDIDTGIWGGGELIRYQNKNLYLLMSPSIPTSCLLWRMMILIEMGRRGGVWFKKVNIRIKRTPPERRVGVPHQSSNRPNVNRMKTKTLCSKRPSNYPEKNEMLNERKPEKNWEENLLQSFPVRSFLPIWRGYTQKLMRMCLGLGTLPTAPCCQLLCPWS